MEVTYMLVALFCASGLRRVLLTPCCDNCEHLHADGNCRRCGNATKTCSEPPQTNGAIDPSCSDATFYGKNCQMKCSNTCINSQCQLQNATLVCTDGCVPGKKGVYCLEDCPSSCTQCERYSNTCVGPCSDASYYGERCQIHCRGNCEDGCARYSGDCTSCGPGYRGAKCDVPCPPACEECQRYATRCTKCLANRFYGSNCVFPCPNDCVVCNKETGYCTECKHGYSGGKCEAHTLADRWNPNLAIITVVAVLFLGAVLLFVYKLWTHKYTSHQRHLEHQPGDETHARAAPESSDSNAHRYWDITDPLSEPEPTNYSQPQRDDVVERGDFMGYCSIQRRAEIDQTRGECSSLGRSGDFPLSFLTAYIMNGTIRTKQRKARKDDMDTNMSRILLVRLLCSVSCIIGAPDSRHCLWSSASDPCPACERGWYGGDCNFNCSFCDSGVCVRDTGICKQCRAGYFSHNCNVTCPPNCRKNDDGKMYCDRQSGVCLQNCKDGWWGDWCERKCSDRCQDNSCYFWDGSCARGCRKGWAGDSCDTLCPGGCHGDTCEQNGSHTCTRGCKHGVHGHHCNKKCNRHCRDQDCFYDHRMNSTVCRQGCVDGWMSLDCKLKCPGNCEACSQETGECSRCKQGYWGTDCTRTCSATCFNQTCDQGGRCSSCQLGYHGDTCRTYCDADCIRCFEAKGGCRCREPCTSSCLHHMLPDLTCLYVKEKKGHAGVNIHEITSRNGSSWYTSNLSIYLNLVILLTYMLRYSYL
ncbi:uncharacterized protein LOC124111915 [Haliotis rufescens]|uniref:uncharacterized protein LOC124111915 n=1 Tax=Haliotis rufescens TaxID=6454 RepID=UPI00201E93F1|nr:uncharacterized protein LOC124111915 [Haliotis rufescens]